MIALGERGGLRADRGALLVLLAAAATAAYFAWQKPYLRRCQPAALLAVTIWLATVVLLPWLPAWIGQLRAAPATATVALVFLRVVPTVIAYLAWSRALARRSATLTASSLYALPALAIGIAWLWLGEVPRPMALAGGELVLVGVVITQLGARPTGTPAPDGWPAPPPHPRPAPYRSAPPGAPGLPRATSQPGLKADSPLPDLNDPGHRGQPVPDPAMLAVMLGIPADPPAMLAAPCPATRLLPRSDDRLGQPRQRRTIAQPRLRRDPAQGRKDRWSRRASRRRPPLADKELRASEILHHPARFASLRP